MLRTLCIYTWRFCLMENILSKSHPPHCSLSTEFLQNLQIQSDHFCLPPSIIYSCPWIALWVFSLCQELFSWFITFTSHPSLQNHPMPSPGPMLLSLSLFSWSWSHPYSSLSVKMDLKHLLYRKAFMTVHSKAVLMADSYEHLFCSWCSLLK